MYFASVSQEIFIESLLCTQRCAVYTSGFECCVAAHPSDRHGCHLSVHEDPPKEVPVPWEWGKGFLKTGQGSFFSPWNLAITNMIFPTIFEEIFRTIKVMLKHEKVQLLIRMMAIWPIRMYVLKILMKPLDFLPYILNFLLLPIIKFTQGKCNHLR